MQLADRILARPRMYPAVRRVFLWREDGGSQDRNGNKALARWYHQNGLLQIPLCQLTTVLDTG